jgi:hypothetical protein
MKPRQMKQPRGRESGGRLVTTWAYCAGAGAIAGGTDGIALADGSVQFDETGMP